MIESWVAGFNSRDISAIKPLIAERCRLIDSRGDSIEGREDCLEALQRLFDLDPSYRINLSSIETTADDTLMRGSVSASDPRLTATTLWRARSNRKQLLEWQSFAPGTPISLAHILMGEKAHRNTV